MQAEGTDIVPQWPTAAGFHNRAAAVFGSLEGSVGGTVSSDLPSWSLSQDHIFRSGKANDYSSEEEEEAKEIERRQREFLPGSMQELEGDENEDEVFRPSAAFCKALDKEQEYDDSDAMAMGERLGDPDARPAGTTEVLEENVYEQRSRLHDAEARLASEQGIAAMQVEGRSEGLLEQGMPEVAASNGSFSTPEIEEAAVRKAALPPNARGQGESDVTDERGALDTSAVPEVQDEDEKRRAKKKVRFQEPWVPPHRRDDENGSKLRSTPSDSQRLIRPRQLPRNRSYVPDHVKNPHRYTCYTLDEPILVGGGDQGRTAADGGQAEMERAARAAMSAARSVLELEQPAAAKELPAFGSGIEFRPQSKRSKDAPVRSAGADQSNKSGTVAVQLMEQEEVVEDMQEAMDVEEDAPMIMQPRKPRRNFRAKPTGEQPAD
ncbi:g11049 [Coccomyxa elongata]